MTSIHQSNACVCAHAHVCTHTHTHKHAQRPCHSRREQQLPPFALLCTTTLDTLAHAICRERKVFNVQLPEEDNEELTSDICKMRPINEMGPNPQTPTNLYIVYFLQYLWQRLYRLKFTVCLLKKKVCAFLFYIMSNRTHKQVKYSVQFPSLRSMDRKSILVLS